MFFPGAAAGGLSKLADVVLGGDNNAIAASSLPVYKAYMYILYYDVDVASDALMTFNATAAGYYGRGYGTDGKSDSNAAYFTIGTTNTGRKGMIQGYIYADGTYADHVSMFMRGSDGDLWSSGGGVSLGAALSGITLINGAGANKWKAGTRLLVYGIEKN